VSVVTIVICASMKFYLVLYGVTNPNIFSIVVVVFFSDDCHLFWPGQKHPGYNESSWLLDDTPCVLECNFFRKGMKISF